MDKQSVTIRRAEEADLPALLAMYRALYTHLNQRGMRCLLDEQRLPGMLKTQLRSHLCHILVALNDTGSPCGFINTALTPIDRRLQGGMMGYIRDIYVQPELRRTGAASALLRRAEDWMRASGVTDVECSILTDNAEGQGFWRSQGYLPTSVQAQKQL